MLLNITLTNILDAMSDVLEHSVALFGSGADARRLHFLESFDAQIELPLEHSDQMRRLLVLLLKHCLYPRHLNLVRARSSSQQKILVHVLCNIDR